MPDTTTNIEKLDLRFIAAPKNSRSTWMPGNAWLWFLMGALIGIAGWAYGRKELKTRLAEQLSTDNSVSKSLFALEALELLDPQALDHLVTGLHHTDPRVARSAYQKINLHCDQWATAEISLQYASMKSLAVQLERIPAELPEPNLVLVRSLAARLYSTSVSIDDPQIKPVTEICERLLALSSLPSQSPPAPLPPESAPPETGLDSIENVDATNLSATETPSLTPTLDNTQPIHRSSSTPVASLRLVASPTRPRTNETSATVVNRQSPALVPVLRPNEFQLTDSSDVGETELGDTAHTDLPSSPTTGALTVGSEFPIVVATPASISTQPIARLKTVATQADLAGIEKLAIAELFRLLAHANADVAKAAALGLRHKGITDRSIQLASELATGSALRRLELIQQIATSGEGEPVPWLLWMGEDGEPEVRKMAVSLLITMADESVFRSLRILAARESDSQIRHMILRALLNAPG